MASIENRCRNSWWPRSARRARSAPSSRSSRNAAASAGSPAAQQRVLAVDERLARRRCVGGDHRTRRQARRRPCWARPGSPWPRCRRSRGTRGCPPSRRPRPRTAGAGNVTLVTPSWSARARTAGAVSPSPTTSMARGRRALEAVGGPHHVLEPVQRDEAGVQEHPETGGRRARAPRRRRRRPRPAAAWRRGRRAAR